jgi:hypothetical protein
VKIGFLDTNIIDHCRRLGKSGYLLRECLAKNNFEPAIGPYVIYELSKNIKGENGYELMKKLFLIIKELNPKLVWPREIMYEIEFSQIKIGEEIDFIANSNLQVEFSNIITEYIEGKFDSKKLIADIDEREAGLQRDRDNWCNTIKLGKDKVWTLEFSDYRDEILKEHRENIILGLQRNLYKSSREQLSLSQEEISLVLHELGKCPAIRTLLYSQIYLEYIYAKNGDMARKKLPDLLQLIEASHSDGFISNDEKLLQYAVDINPNLEYRKFTDSMELVAAY